MIATLLIIWSVNEIKEYAELKARLAEIEKRVSPGLYTGGGDEYTSTPIVAQRPNEPQPEFYPMPGPGEVLEGLRRGALYCLWRDGEIETISIRRKGKTRGRRLIVADSLRRYLRKLREDQCGPVSGDESDK